jgi:ATP-dependent Clp protease protease subunit
LKKPMWELKQSVDPGVLELYIYGDVEGDYFDWWSWSVVESETSAMHFRNELAKYQNVSQINIYINSYGGSVFEGTSIYNQLRRHPAQKTVYVDGFACSIAAVIALAGDKVVMPKNTMMFIHDVQNGAFGNPRQLRKAADDLDVILTGNRQAFLEKSSGKISEEKLKELLEAETWLTAAQCVEYGFADELIERDADMSGAQQMLQKMNKSLEQQLKYQKALTAQFRDLELEAPEPRQEPNPPAGDPEPGLIGDQDPPDMDPVENKPLKFLQALMR